MPTLTKLYTLKEAAEHNTSDDCWVVVHGKVYDVTNYLDEHPGGMDVLLDAVGRDATDEFEDAGHGKSARELMQDYFIGEIYISPAIEELTVFRKEETSILNYKIMNKPLQFWALPLALVSISVGAGLLFMRRK